MGVLRKKSVDDVINQNAEGDAKEHLRKNLGAKDLIGFGIGIVIGTGIFTLTGLEAKEHAGPAVMISFVVAGVVALLAALCYAELAAAVPTAGSSYTYAYSTIGEIFAWIIAWDLILEFALGASVVARGWSAISRASSICRRSGSPRKGPSSTSAPSSSRSSLAGWRCAASANRSG